MNLIEDILKVNIFEEENIFKGATAEDLEQRKAGHIKAIIEDAGFTKNEDGTITVESDLSFYNMNLKSLLDLPYKIREVKGSFDCGSNELTSLEGAPETVSEGGFYCGSNKLTSLEGSPKIVKGAFYCGDNKLTSLEGAPQRVGLAFVCSNNVKQFTEEDVDAVSAVEGEIIV